MQQALLNCFMTRFSESGERRKNIYFFIIGGSNIMFLNEKNPTDNESVTINFDIIYYHKG